MNRAFRSIKILLAVAVLLCGFAAVVAAVGACDSCATRTSVPLPLLGAVFYGALLAGAVVLGPVPAVSIGIILAAAVHGVLVGQMISTGTFCVICALAAVNSIALLFLTFACDPQNVVRTAFVLPTTAACTTMILFVAAGARAMDAGRVVQATTVASPAEITDAVRLIVFEKADCPYCVELREQLIPRARAEFGSRLHVTLRQASELPGINYTPTVVVVPPGRAHGKIIEGLPPYDQLRDAIMRALSAKGL